MSNLIETIQAFESLDYQVLEYTSDHITVQSVHDYTKLPITIHATLWQLSPQWIESHFVDRLTPYLDQTYPDRKK